MSILSGKKILLGITAGIAAYKSAFLVRLFVKAGVEVKVILTPAAKDFVTPLTLSTLSNNEVYSSFTQNETETWNNHVELALWADLLVIAPATANTLSKMAHGTCDNLLLATYLSSKCPVYYAPAMDLDMYKHSSVQFSFDTLKSFGVTQIPATYGELASGLVGEGRMAEPQDIVTFLENDILSQLPLHNKKVLITAGPTHEAIDPVRYIGNHSSGKMGFALAHQAATLGAEVFLIAGPNQEKIVNSSINLIAVTTAAQMYAACHDHFASCTIAILAAAVADFKPKNVATQKIKKNQATLTIELEPTKDILQSLGAIKKQQLLIGFALETENEIENAKNKLKKKNLDFIVLNSLNDKASGFQFDTNKITLIDKKNSIKKFDLKSKALVAHDIFNEIIPLINE